MVDQKISQHRAAEGSDERCHHRVSQGRAPLSQNRKCERFWTLPAGEEARAELLSSRPITVINPFTPGASSDTLQRIVNKKVSENTGHTLVVESRPGGGGIVAAVVAKQASPDGHTLLQANAGTHATNASLYATLPYDPIKDFRPITLMWSFP